MPLAGKWRTARAPTAALLAAVFLNLALIYLVLLQVRVQLGTIDLRHVSPHPSTSSCAGGTSKPAKLDRFWHLQAYLLMLCCAAMRRAPGSSKHVTPSLLYHISLVLRQVHARWLAPPGAPPPHSSLRVHIRASGAAAQRLAAQRWLGSGAQLDAGPRNRKLLQSWTVAPGSTQAHSSLDR